MADDNEDRIKRIPINEIHQEDGASELVNSPNMEPYIRLAMARLQGADTTDELEEIRQLPLEKRYVWRVASALKWAFADFDTVNVTADRETLLPEDRTKVLDLLMVRPLQFCLFLKALFGPEEMKRVMIQAISTAGRLP